jgi:biopolymer transport protein ExbD
MSRRELPEINAGSMADIAFLLLIFFLVTTTMDSDEGILVQLPPPVPEDQIDPPPVKKKNVYVVLVNAQDQLLVEGDFMKIDKLKDGAKEFLIANGVFRDLPIKDDFPVRSWVRKAEVDAKVEELNSYIASSSDANAKKSFADQLKKWERKQKAIEIFGEYKELPGSAIISMQNDNGTSYDMYIQVRNELESAVNELRDELCLEKFGMVYSEIEQLADQGGGEKYKDRLYAVRQIYPQRVSEAEPLNLGSY